MMMFGGSPMRVEVPPMLLRMACSRGVSGDGCGRLGSGQRLGWVQGFRTRSFRAAGEDGSLVS